MITLTDGHIRFDADRCMQCGACVPVCPTGALSFVGSGDGLSSIEVNDDLCIRCGKCERVCPSAKEQNFDGYFDDLKSEKYFLGYNADSGVRRQSSSGGVCRTLIVESLRNGLVDGVYALGKEDRYPFAKGRFYTSENLPAYSDLPTSVYHTVLQCEELKTVKKCHRLMIVGTSCQLRALSAALKGKCDELITVCIFCKQQKTLGSTRFLAKMAGKKLVDDSFSASYRGEGWPGNVRIDGASVPWHRAAQLPFGRRLWTVPGCNACGDPFGRFAGADIALMDPWTIRPHNELGETLVTALTPEGEKLLQSIDRLLLDSKTFDEVIPALDLTDIRRKQALVPFFRHESCSVRIKAAARAEQAQRWFFRTVLNGLPRMPMIVYRAMCKLPDWRNILIGKI